MAVAQLYVRVSKDGKQQYARAVFLPNGNLKPNHCLIEGKPERFADGVYHLRYSVAGKRVWESLRTTDPTLAVQRYRLKLNDLEAPAAPPAPSPDPEPVPEPASQAVGITLAEAVDAYLKETATHKSRKTLAAYKLTLNIFKSSCAKETLHSLTREDMLNFITFMKRRGNAPRTIRNRVDFLQIFLHHYKIPSLLVGKDKPVYTDKKVRAYSSSTLDTLFNAATEDERDLLTFLLCTGTREQEVQYACWSDVDLSSKQYRVTEHLDLGFRPKDKDEGLVPLADVLVDRLTARRKRYPKSRLIFPGSDGKPDGHLLRIIKRLALKAGANCGHCTNKAGKSCATHPVCREIFLHRLRKTYATTLHRSGVPARTIQSFLRHSSLDTTLRYLADVQDDKTIEQVNSAFGVFGGTLSK